MVERIIIDTDPGIDDTLAIFYALESGALDVVGLTTVFGNVETALATRNALRLLEIAERREIPVAGGATRPLARPFRGPIPHIHGDDGQGNCDLPPPEGRPIGQTAAEFIVDQVSASPGEITLVPIGPLTNIALALHLRPEIVARVKRVVLMGGAALVPGNVNPAAEANVFNDPEAADIVFSAPWDITMIGLDVTHKVLLPSQSAARYARSSKQTSRHIGRILPLYLDFAHRALGRSASYIHDATAISYLLDPSLFEVARYPVKVETRGISRGKTWVWTRTRDHPPEDFGFDTDHPATVVLGAAVETVHRMMLETV